MIRRPPRSTRTDTLVPNTTRFRSLLIGAGALRTDDSALFDPSWQMLYGGGAVVPAVPAWWREAQRSEEHTSELQSRMRTSYAVFCLKKQNDVIYLSLIHISEPTIHISLTYPVECL